MPKFPNATQARAEIESILTKARQTTYPRTAGSTNSNADSGEDDDYSDGDHGRHSRALFWVIGASSNVPLGARQTQCDVPGTKTSSRPF